jgi:hypothetical protein
MSALGQAVPPHDVFFVTRTAGDCGPDGAVFDRAVAPGPGGRLEVKATTGAPYSAVGTTKVVRTLSDGNRIVRTNTMKYARDGQGRTRTEYALAALGPFALEDTHTLVTIEDPVASKRYVLHPEMKRADVFDTKAGPWSKGEWIFGGPGAPVPGPAGGAVTVTSSARIAVPEAGTEVAGGDQTIAVAPPAMGVAVAGGGPIEQRFMSFTCGAQGVQTKRLPPPVSLGERTIQGIKAVGSRQEYEIPAGAVGNEQPITVRTEQWFSPDLGVVIQSKHEDPLMGDTTYELTQIKRGEPDATLFTVPAGYTTQQGPQPIIQKFEQRVPAPQQ